MGKEEQWIPRHILVTDGSVGIGKEICQKLLVKGHNVVFTCDCEATAISAKKEFWASTGNPKVDYIVGSLDSVKNANIIASKIRKHMPSINTLVHNVNLWSTQMMESEDGLELTFMTNYMARYILNNELVPLMDQNRNSRIIFVTPESNVIEPDLNMTPFGKDFHWRKSFSKTMTCCIIC